MNYDISLLSHVEAEVNTIKGKIQVEWKRSTAVGDNPSTVHLSVTIPPNTKGLVTLEPTLPHGRCQSITESGKVMWRRGELLEETSKSIGLTDLVEEKESARMMLSIEAGIYTFIVDWQ